MFCGNYSLRKAGEKPARRGQSGTHFLPWTGVGKITSFIAANILLHQQKAVLSEETSAISLDAIKSGEKTMLVRGGEHLGVDAW